MGVLARTRTLVSDLVNMMEVIGIIISPASFILVDAVVVEEAVVVDVEVVDLVDVDLAMVMAMTMATRTRSQ